MKRVGIAMLGGLLATGPALVQASQWGGEAELGIVSTEGNTETQTISAKGKAVNEREKWKHQVNLAALNTQDNDTTTAERYEISGKSDYKLNPRDYLFVTARYEDDRFSGYDWRAAEAVGYGRKVITEEHLSLDLEAGVGARQSKLDSGQDEDEGMILLSGLLDWKISDTSTFTEELSSEIGEDVTISKSVTGLKTQINSILAMKLTYTVKHVSEVPAGIEKVDRETAVTLVYSF